MRGLISRSDAQFCDVNGEVAYAGKAIVLAASCQGGSRRCTITAGSDWFMLVSKRGWSPGNCLAH